MIRCIQNPSIAGQAWVASCELFVSRRSIWCSLSSWLWRQRHPLPFFDGILDFGFELFEILDDTFDALAFCKHCVGLFVLRVPELGMCRDVLEDKSGVPVQHHVSS